MVDDAYHRAWEGLWYLDTTNPAIWWTGSGSNATFSFIADSEEVIDRFQVAGGAGQTFTFPFFDIITHIDIWVAPSGAPGAGTTHLAYVNSCLPPGGAITGFSETVTLMHELGHGYGYDHMDGWLSNLNTFQTDSFSCELGTSTGAGVSMYVQPDAHPTQCHDLVYGIYNGVDLSATPAIQPAGCILANGICALIPGPLVTFPSSATTSGAQTIQFTTFSNRDGLPVGAGGDVRIRAWMSSDSVLGGGDVLPQTTIFGALFDQPGETRVTTMIMAFNPQTALPVVGTTYRVLIQVDSNNAHAETRESNNLIDTNFRFRRL